MLHVSGCGKSLLYTGNFRSNGRKSFASLLRKLLSVDLLITEGTTLSRNDLRNQTEEELETRAYQEISKTDAPVFVLMAGTNIDRIRHHLKSSPVSWTGVASGPVYGIRYFCNGRQHTKPKILYPCQGIPCIF